MNDVHYTMVADTAQLGALSMTFCTCAVLLTGCLDSVDTGSKETSSVVRAIVIDFMCRILDCIVVSLCP